MQKFISKKFISTSMMFLLILSLAVPTVAHDGWSQTNTPIIEPGEVAYVELLFGNHSNEHASYRIDGTWNADDTDVTVTTPNGEKVHISDTIFYMGELSDVQEEQLGVNNYHIGSFSATSPGIYVISAERDSVFAHGESANRTLRSAKSFVAISEIPLVHAVKHFDGYDKQVTPDRAELIPLFNPVAVTPGEEVSVQLFKEGESLADTEITLIRRSTSDVERLVTNEDGVITFKTGPADYYLLRAKPSTDESVEGEYDSTNYEATMTFTVQNGSGLTVEELGSVVSVDPAENEIADTATDLPNQDRNVFNHPFFYVSLLLGLGFIVSLTFLLRK